ncbi:MAG: CoA transferase [Chloroflexi bacterium]|nr:CoA transferase [Chloroflexota bacterium]
MPGILEGIKVLEVANWVAAPSACAMLADMGAEVIKIEHPETGDAVRSIANTTRGMIPYPGGLNVVFQLLNRGKQSMGVNLGNPQGREIVRKLAADSDVMVTNLTPHRQERYGLRYEDVSALNPRIIYLTLTGYGMNGPERDRSGFDYAAFWARSGIMGTLGEEGEPPVQQRPGMGDQTTSLAMTAAIGMALYERERSGKGQRVDCSLLHTGLWVLGGDAVAALHERRAVQRNRRQQAGNPLFNFYEAGDGKWMQLVMIESERFWAGFCRALGLERLIDDPRFDDHFHRVEHSQELFRILEEQFATKSRPEWAKLLDEEGCIWAPIQTLDEVIEDPQVRANGYTSALEHQEEGEFEVVTTPMSFQRTPAEAKSPAPELGQHTESKLLELGYTWDDITALKEQGAII